MFKQALIKTNCALNIALIGADCLVYVRSLMCGQVSASCKRCRTFCFPTARHVLQPEAGSETLPDNPTLPALQDLILPRLLHLKEKH